MIYKEQGYFFIDRAPLIYYFEDHLIYAPILDDIFKKIEQKEIHACTSVITLIEILTKPLLEKNDLLARQYEKILFHARGFSVKEITPEIALTAAHLRAEYRFKTPDAIQLAVAVTEYCEAMITNDKKFKSVKDIDIWILDEMMNG